MNRKEFAVLSDLIKNSGFIPQRAGDEILSTPEKMNRWYDLLKDLDFEVAVKAVNEYAMTNKFAPTIADIREYAGHYNGQADIPNAMEAWSLVSKALRNSGRNAEEEFAKLPPIIQKSVGRPALLRNWAMDENFNEGVESSAFMRTYRVEVERAKEFAKLPTNLQQQIAAKTLTVALTDGESGNVINLLSAKDRAAYAGNTDTTRTLPPGNFREILNERMEG